MSDQDSEYIRKAVEVAEGWKLHGRQETGHGYRLPDRIETMEGYGGSVDSRGEIIDALAAQLRLQAQWDPHITFKISVIDSMSYVEMMIYNPHGDEEAEPLRFVGHEENEAMAFIKPIIDSDVLPTGGASDE